MNDAEVTVSANGTPPRRTRPSRDSSGNPSQSRSDRRRIHLVLQGKGGIGKSLAASYLVQYHRHIGKPVKAFDADPINASLAAMPGLDAQPIASLSVRRGRPTMTPITWLMSHRSGAKDWRRANASIKRANSAPRRAASSIAGQLVALGVMPARREMREQVRFVLQQASMAGRVGQQS